jgi:cell division protein FtsB
MQAPCTEILTCAGARMSSKQDYKQPSRWTTAVDTAQSRVYAFRRTAATFAAGTLAVFMGYHVVFGQNGLIAYEHKREDTKALQVQTQSLQQENDRLRGHVDRLQNDPGAIEHQAREELHYTRAGEVIYTLPPDPQPQTAPNASKP